MTTTVTTFIDSVFRWPIVDERGFLSKNWVQWFLRFVHRDQLIVCDTSGGAGTYTLGPARKNQNVEVIIFKDSADANVVTIAVSGTDVTKPANLTITAQYGKLRLISDGVSTWRSV